MKVKGTSLKFNFKLVPLRRFRPLVCKPAYTLEQDEDSDGEQDICLLPCDKSFLAFVLQVDSSGLGWARVLPP